MDLRCAWPQVIGKIIVFFGTTKFSGIRQFLLVYLGFIVSRGIIAYAIPYFASRYASATGTLLV